MGIDRLHNHTVLCLCVFSTDVSCLLKILGNPNTNDYDLIDLLAILDIVQITNITVV